MDQALARYEIRPEGQHPLPSSISELKKGTRILGAAREALRDVIRKQYDEGATIRAIADETGRSYGFVHRLLKESGAKLRKRGGNPRKNRKADSQAP